MMQGKESEFARSQAEVARMHKLQASLEHLYQEEKRLATEEQELAMRLKKEKGDVDALNRVSLSSILSAIRGNKEERLIQEQMEVHAAVLKHDAAVCSLQQTRGDIRTAEEELASLSGCEERWKAAAGRRLEEIKRTQGEEGEKAYALEERMGFLMAQKQQLQEAIQAGKAAIRQIDSIEGSLGDAEGWGLFDVMGGGMLSTMAKHSHLDDAQQQAKRLQSSLSRFRTELADVQIAANPSIQIDGFLRFADYFFDGLLVDWMVLDGIGDSQAQVAATRRQVQSLLKKLDEMDHKIEDEIEALKKELLKLIIS